MKKKFFVVLLAVVSMFCLCLGLAACGKEKFSISTLKKIPMGASQEKVESVLGKPSEGSRGDTEWVYYDNSFLTYAKKAENLKKEQDDAISASDLAKAEQLRQEYDSLMQEVAGKQFSCIEVTFSTDGKVTSVFLDKAYSESGSQEKQIDSDEIFYGGSSKTIERHYYIDYRTSEEGERIFIKNTTEKNSLSYATTFTDGSWYHALLNDWDGQILWTWTDMNGEHTAKKPENVNVNDYPSGRISKDGEWSGAFYALDGYAMIPDGVTSIASDAFLWCEGLKSITIPASVTSIGILAAFGDFSGLEHITVASGNPVYHSEGECVIVTATNTLILGCKNSVIPAGVTEIKEYAFYKCTTLKSIAIPASVTEISWQAFEGCSGLTSINIPDSVTSIGYRAFCGCTGLTSVTMGSGVIEIGKDVFLDCVGLKSVDFKNPNGWHVDEDYYSTENKPEIPREDLQDQMIAAQYLGNTYCNFFWKRKT